MEGNKSESTNIDENQIYATYVQKLAIIHNNDNNGVDKIPLICQLLYLDHLKTLYNEKTRTIRKQLSDIEKQLIPIISKQENKSFDIIEPNNEEKQIFGPKGNLCVHEIDRQASSITFKKLREYIGEFVSHSQMDIRFNVNPSDFSESVLNFISSKLGKVQKVHLKRNIFKPRANKKRKADQISSDSSSSSSLTSLDSSDSNPLMYAPIPYIDKSKDVLYSPQTSISLQLGSSSIDDDDDNDNEDDNEDDDDDKK